MPRSRFSDQPIAFAEPFAGAVWLQGTWSGVLEEAEAGQITFTISSFNQNLCR